MSSDDKVIIAAYERLFSIAAALNDATSIDETLTALAQPAFEDGATFASMMFIDTDENGEPEALETVARLGDPALGQPVGARLTLWNSPMIAFALGNPTHPLFMPRIFDPEITDEQTQGLLGDIGVQATIAMPLYKRGEWIALAAFNWTQPHEFHDDLYFTYQKMATLAAPVVENQRVMAQLAREQHNGRLSLLALTEALTQRTRTLHDILSAIQQYYVMIDRERRVLYANPLILETFRVTEAQVIGKHWETVHPLSPAVFQAIKTQIDSVFDSGETTRFEQQFAFSDRTLYVEITIAPIRDDDGAVMAIVTSGQDITERKRAEAHQRDLAVERERKWLLTHIVRGAGHEFRNPLAVIRTKLYLLERIADADRRREHLAVLGQQVDAILYLVESLHIIALLEDPDNYEYDDVNIARLIERTRWRHDSQITQKGHTVTVEAGDRALTLYGNETLLSQLLDYLCDNAIKYTPSGGEISLRVTTSDEEICITVQDNGPGIPAEKQAEVFEYFMWIKHEGAPRGQGLGLSLAQKIAALHGGEIRLKSTPGAGCTFSVHLPHK